MKNINKNIHLIAKENKLDQIEALLAKEPDLVYTRDNNDWTPLYAAVKKGRYPRIIEKHGDSPPQYPDWE